MTIIPLRVLSGAVLVALGGTAGTFATTPSTAVPGSPATEISSVLTKVHALAGDSPAATASTALRGRNIHKGESVMTTIHRATPAAAHNHPEAITLATAQTHPETITPATAQTHPETITPATAQTHPETITLAAAHTRPEAITFAPGEDRPTYLINLSGRRADSEPPRTIDPDATQPIQLPPAPVTAGATLADTGATAPWGIALGAAALGAVGVGLAIRGRRPRGR